MTAEAQAIQAFLSGFCAAYAEFDAPPGAAGPYITWSPLAPGRREGADLGVRIWRRGAGRERLFALAGAVIAAVGAGIRLALPEGGALWVYAGEPAVICEAQKPGVACVRLYLMARRVD